MCWSGVCVRRNGQGCLGPGVVIQAGMPGWHIRVRMAPDESPQCLSPLRSLPLSSLIRKFHLHLCQVAISVKVGIS